MYISFFLITGLLSNCTDSFLIRWYKTTGPATTAEVDFYHWYPARLLVRHVPGRAAGQEGAISLAFIEWIQKTLPKSNSALLLYPAYLMSARDGVSADYRASDALLGKAAPAPCTLAPLPIWVYPLSLVSVSSQWTQTVSPTGTRLHVGDCGRSRTVEPRPPEHCPLSPSRLLASIENSWGPANERHTVDHSALLWDISVFLRKLLAPDLWIRKRHDDL